MNSKYVLFSVFTNSLALILLYYDWLVTDIFNIETIYVIWITLFVGLKLLNLLWYKQKMNYWLIRIVNYTLIAILFFNFFLLIMFISIAFSFSYGNIPLISIFALIINISLLVNCFAELIVLSKD